MNRYHALALLILLTLLWVSACGVWPFAHPEHNFSTVLGTIDLILHWAATTSLLCLVIANHPRTSRTAQELEGES